tara:strand:+ start:18868 stop:19134 length:267 start_codon:yes stop_codon:yes gene_type:complete
MDEWWGQFTDIENTTYNNTLEKNNTVKIKNRVQVPVQSLPCILEKEKNSANFLDLIYNTNISFHRKLFCFIISSIFYLCDKFNDLKLD